MCCQSLLVGGHQVANFSSKLRITFLALTRRRIWFGFRDCVCVVRKVNRNVWFNLKGHIQFAKFFVKVFHLQKLIFYTELPPTPWKDLVALKSVSTIYLLSVDLVLINVKRNVYRGNEIFPRVCWANSIEPFSVIFYVPSLCICIVNDIYFRKVCCGNDATENFLHHLLSVVPNDVKLTCIQIWLVN